MWKWLSLLNQNCRTATRLMGDARRRTLTRVERAGLAGHLMICPACRQYRGQVEGVEQLARAAVRADGEPFADNASPRPTDGGDPVLPGENNGTHVNGCTASPNK